MHTRSLSSLATIASLCATISACSSDVSRPELGTQLGRLEATASDYRVYSQRVSESPSQLTFNAEVVNTSAEPASGLTLYYYFNNAAHAPLTAAVDWASAPVSVSTLDIGGDIKAFAFQIEGSVPAGGSVKLQLRLHTSNWTPANFADDFSYQGVLVERSENRHTGLYQGAELVFGTAKDGDLEVPLPGGNLNRLEVSTELVQEFGSQLAFKLWVKNIGANNVSDIEARYLLNPSGQSSATVVALDWASCGVTAKVEPLTTDQERVVFDFGDTALTPGAECELHVRVHAADWSSLDFSDDASHLGLTGTRSPNPSTPGFIAGKQVFGNGVSDPHWEIIGAPEDFPGIVEQFVPRTAFGVSPEGTRYAYYTTDAGNPAVSRYVDQNWEELTTSGLEQFEVDVRVAFIGETPVLYNLQEVRAFGGAAWELLASPGALGVTRTDATALTPSGEVFATIEEAGAAQLYTATGGSSWSALGSPITGVNGRAMPLYLASSPNGNLYLAWADLAPHSGTIYVSAFDGAEWAKLSQEGVDFSHFGGSTRTLSITRDEQVFFELVLGGLRSTFFYSYTVLDGSLSLFSSWGIGPFSPPCQHPVPLFVDDDGNVFRSSNFVDQGLNHYYLEQFDFTAGAWQLQSSTLQSSTYLASSAFYCQHTLDSSESGELSVMASEGVVSAYFE